MKTLKISWLLQHGACKGQIENFQRCFGNAAELNRDNLVKGVKAGLNLNWLARKLGMIDFQFKEYDLRAVDAFLEK